MRRKMVLIGAGGLKFTHRIIFELIEDSQRVPWHIALVDIDPKGLDAAVRITNKMIASKNADIEVSYSTERRDVLPGADYIVTAISVGGRDAEMRDYEITTRHGSLFPSHEYPSPIGMSIAMRMIPVFIEIASDIKKLCPNAHFFNFSNPMTAICTGVKKAGFPIIGLCHGVKGMQKIISETFAGIDDKKVTNYSVGVNHMTIMTDYLYDGRDAWHILRDKLDEKKRNGEEITEPFGWDFFDENGGRAFPLPGDGHAISYFPERFPGGVYYGKKIGVEIFNFITANIERDEQYKRDVARAYSPEPLPGYFFDGLAGYREEILEIIVSMERDLRRVFSVNVTNNGAIKNLPPDAVVELPAAATAKGLLPLQINGFPDEFAKIIIKLLATADAVAEAALKGDKKLFAEAVLMGGYMMNKIKIQAMVEELISAQRDHLPQF